MNFQGKLLLKPLKKLGLFKFQRKRCFYRKVIAMKILYLNQEVLRMQQLLMSNCRNHVCNYRLLKPFAFLVNCLGQVFPTMFSMMFVVVEVNNRLPLIKSQP